LTSTIESGGARRAAALALMLVSHPDINEFIDAKLVDKILNAFNISVGVTENFLESVELNKDWDLTFNQKIYKTVKARDLWNKIINNMLISAEPGILNWDKLRENNSYYFSPIISTNPCFSNDTKVLTKQGHFEIKDLVGREVDIWDGISWKRINNFRTTGTNEKMLKITLYDGSELRVTPYHKFYLENGVCKEAKDLSIEDKLSVSNAPIIHGNINIKGAYIKGFLLGDGTLKTDRPILKLYHPKYCLEDKLISSANEIPIEVENTNSTSELKFNYENVNNRKNLTGLTPRKNELYKWCKEYRNKLPKEIFQWNLKSKCEFIAGYFDADCGAMDTKNGFGYQVWANSKEMLLDIQLLLKTLGVFSKLSIGKEACKKDFNDGYGEYNCSKSYRLTISQKNSIILSKLITFHRLISFKDKTITYNLKNRFNTIISIKNDGIDKEVYCCTVDSTHKVSLSLGILTGQCGEVPLEAYGVCCIGSLVLPSFIKGVTYTDWGKLAYTIKMAVRFLDDVIDINKYTLQEIERRATEGRRIGLGVMGLAEYLFAKKVPYGSDKAIRETERLMKFIRDNIYVSLVELASEKGAFPKFEPVAYGKAKFIRTLPASLRMDIKQFGTRCVTGMALAPTGTISLIPEVQSGIEPLFLKGYKRKDRISERIYIHPLYKQALLENKGKTPKWFVDTADLSPKDHFETQVAVQKFTDGAVSKTINLPKGITASKLNKLMLEYLYDLKGVTIYVDGSREGQILNPITAKEAMDYIKKEKDNDSADIETVTCSSGTCEI